MIVLMCESKLSLKKKKPKQVRTMRTGILSWHTIKKELKNLGGGGGRAGLRAALITNDGARSPGRTISCGPAVP